MVRSVLVVVPMGDLAFGQARQKPIPRGLEGLFGLLEARGFAGTPGRDRQRNVDHPIPDGARGATSRRFQDSRDLAPVVNYAVVVFQRVATNDSRAEEQLPRLRLKGLGL